MPLRTTGRPLPADAPEEGRRTVPDRGRIARRAVGVLVSAVLGVGGLVAVGAPAEAAESYPVPATGTFTFSGHGWGHGHGLSQWGAYGAALQGLSWQQIEAFYYPGTRISQPTLPDATLRVLMGVDEGTDTRVDPATGLTLTWGTQSLALPTGTEMRGWRLVTWPTDRTRLQLQRLSSTGSWVVWNPATGKDDPTAVVGGDAAFSVAGAGPTTSVSALPRLVLPSGTRRAVRGAIRSVAWAGGGVRTIALVPMEQYLRSVVPAEMPASFVPGSSSPYAGSLAALQAQAVAARTYAARSRAVAGTSPYDVCDSTVCQVFAGSADFTASGTLSTLRENATTDRAVSSTATQVVRYGSGTTDAATLAFTQFSASNGGWTTAGSVPYLVAKQDPYDGVPTSSSNPHSWSATLTATRVATSYPSVGTVTGIEVLSRDGNGEWGGRTTSVRVDGSAGSVTVSGTSFQAAVGLRSPWWTITSGSGTVGSTPTPTPTPTPAPGAGPAWGDRTGDGRGDLVARDGAGYLWLYPGTGSGGVGSRLRIGRSWQGMTALLSVGDLDGDGRADLVARDRSGYLLRYPGTASGGVGTPVRIGRSWQGMTALVGVGDLSGDGRPDLLARDGAGKLWLYPGTAAGGLGTRRQLPGAWGGMTALVGVGDLTGDGRPDLVARDAAGYLYRYPGTAAGGLGSPTRIGRSWQGMTALVGVGDLTGDGRPELVARDGAGDLWAYPGTAAGGLGSRRQIGRWWQGMTALT
ncbi:MAG: SpoIID/LytB domain-containing protein [Motilibacteraceae bacterium]